jgi:hypothetical protein
MSRHYIPALKKLADSESGLQQRLIFLVILSVAPAAVLTGTQDLRHLRRIADAFGMSHYASVSAALRHYKERFDRRRSEACAEG